MLNTIINNEALGVIFPNSYDGLVPELVKERLMASIPFASRYRLVDFAISSMARAGIDNISFSFPFVQHLCSRTNHSRPVTKGVSYKIH